MAAAVLTTACSSATAPKSITVGAVPSTEHILIAEIAAQQVEKKLGVTVERRFDLGSTSIAYDRLVLSAIDIYPEDTNAIIVSVLREPLDPNPDIVLNRVRNELPRVGRIEALDPLGIRHRMCMVIRTGDAKEGNLQTLSDAARSQLAWTLGVTEEFEQRTDAYSTLMRTYSLPLKLAPKPFPARALYDALTNNDASMIAGFDTDGPLNTNAFTVLKDNKNAFFEARTCLLVRDGALRAWPPLRAALDQLSGKFNNETMRKMNYQVEVEKAPVRVVAADFLRQASL